VNVVRLAPQVRKARPVKPAHKVSRGPEAFKARAVSPARRVLPAVTDAMACREIKARTANVAHKAKSARKGSRVIMVCKGRTAALVPSEWPVQSGRKANLVRRALRETAASRAYLDRLVRAASRAIRAYVGRVGSPAKKANPARPR